MRNVYCQWNDLLVDLILSEVASVLTWKETFSFFSVARTLADHMIGFYGLKAEACECQSEVHLDEAGVKQK